MEATKLSTSWSDDWAHFADYVNQINQSPDMVACITGCNEILIAAANAELLADAMEQAGQWFKRSKLSFKPVKK